MHAHNACIKLQHANMVFPGHVAKELPYQWHACDKQQSNVSMQSYSVLVLKLGPLQQ
jgi:hypothetical protein